MIFPFRSAQTGQLYLAWGLETRVNVNLLLPYPYNFSFRLSTFPLLVSSVFPIPLASVLFLYQLLPCKKDPKGIDLKEVGNYAALTSVTT